MPNREGAPVGGDSGEPNPWDTLTEEDKDLSEEDLKELSEDIKEESEEVDVDTGDDISNQETPILESDLPPKYDAQSADYYREHPEEISDLAAALVAARGGADKIKEGATWYTSKMTDDRTLMNAYVADGAPRDWAHLTGYLKAHPDEIDRFVDEYDSLVSTIPSEDVDDSNSGKSDNPDSPFGRAVAAGGGDINNIADQLDDNEIPDAPGWNDEHQFRTHMENGMEGHDDTEAKNEAPKSIDDLKRMGYSDEQIDDWVADGSDPLDVYMNYSPAGNVDPEYQFRAHQQNGMEENPESSPRPNPNDISEQLDDKRHR